jgi:glutamine amidotransferase
VSPKNKTVIIDYGSGNLRSAAKAFKRASEEFGASEVVVTNDPAALKNADHIVLPGVGAFADCKAGLAAVPGMIDALTEQVIANKKPFLGICVGMQLMATLGREHGDTDGFGWIDGEVVEIKPSDAALKIPHMGWNALSFEPGAHPVLSGFDVGAHAYFVHSYHFAVANAGNVLAEVEYGGAVTAMIGRDNMIGTQFHPEKSQQFGLAFIANFLRWPGV